MRITLESTGNFVDMNGVPCRLWQGQTERGIEIFAFIATLAVEKRHDLSAFEEELREVTVVIANA